MARPSNSDLLKKYVDRLSTGKKWRDEEGYDDLWDSLVDLYRGKHFESLSKDDRVAVNIAFSTVNVIAPSVAVNNPKITVNARNPETAPQAVIAEAAVNYWWKHYDIRDEFRRAVKDFLCVGHGWLKCGYAFVEADDVDDDDDSADTPDNLATPKIIVKEDRPFVERVSFHDVFVDPDALTEKDMRWIAQRIRRPISEVRTDKRYDTKARTSVGAGRSGDVQGITSPYRQPVDKQMDYIDIWEFYDIANGKVCVFAEGGDAFLIKPQKMPYEFGHPFVMLRNYDVPDHFYPMGDLEAIEPLQRELNETRTQMINHRKKYSRKYLYRTSAFGPEGRTQMENEADNVLVPVIEDVPLGDVVRPFPTEMTPPEFYNHSSMIVDDANMVSAVSEYMRGGMPEISRTATEAAITQDASNARAADKLAIIEGAIARVGRRLVQLAQQYMTGEQVIRIAGKDSEPVWAQFDREYIAGEFDFEVEGGSTQPVNESFRRQMALQLVDALAPFASVGVVNMQALAAHVLQFGFGVKNPGQFLQAPPPPMPPEGAGGEAGAPPPDAGMMPPDMGGAPPMPDMGMGGGGNTQIDPSVLAQLATAVGLQTPNLTPTPIM